ncbi:uncharacterized protein LOC127788699 isoform X2 [Diospyros lotus]|uniref:uncharacterized protein LOC127788699 isoform X2 n=1 Tax=Diospyros lotus TaxID=55363 RepID=UPI00225544C2|nr:uncharacterized protein LOC127788699 isoform X2 [Diospyros lotus]
MYAGEGHPCSHPLLQGWIEVDESSIAVSSRRRRTVNVREQLSIPGLRRHPRRQVRPPPFFSVENGESNAYGTPDIHSSSGDQKGLPRKNEKSQRESLTSAEFYVAPAPGRMGYLAAVERFLKIMAMVWAGSQVTKLVRAAGALALAPFVERGLSWFTAKFKFESQGKAFMAIVGFCLGLAVMLFFVVTLIWA